MKKSIFIDVENAPLMASKVMPRAGYAEAVNQRIQKMVEFSLGN